MSRPNSLREIVKRFVPELVDVGSRPIREHGHSGPDSTSVFTSIRVFEPNVEFCPTRVGFVDICVVVSRGERSIDDGYVLLVLGLQIVDKAAEFVRSAQKEKSDGF